MPSDHVWASPRSHHSPSPSVTAVDLIVSSADDAAHPFKQLGKTGSKSLFLAESEGPHWDDSLGAFVLLASHFLLCPVKERSALRHRRSRFATRRRCSWATCTMPCLTKTPLTTSMQMSLGSRFAYKMLTRKAMDPEVIEF